MNSLNPEKRSQPSRLSHFLLNFSIAQTHTHVYTHSRSIAHTPFFSFFPYPQTRLLTLTHALSLSLSLSITHINTHTHTHTRFISLNCSSDDLRKGGKCEVERFVLQKKLQCGKRSVEKREEK